MKIANALHKKYRGALQLIQEQVQNSDLNHLPVSIAVGACIGMIPLLGITFIIVSLVSAAFRLNFLVMQAAHLLVSPLQVLLIYPLLRSGQLIFRIASPIPSSGQLNFHYLFTHFHEFSASVFQLLAAGTLVWFFTFSLIGFLLHRFLIRRFRLMRRSVED